ncbi:hypothetical protein OAH46_01170 [Verrucomicrobia bacterium]|nr:hypothetical protein [Verrucomicrobiota bacterium]
MEKMNYISYLAIVISGISLAVSGYGLLRDKSKVKAWCSLSLNTTKSVRGDLELHVYVSNAGRRPVNINYLIMKHPNGHISNPINPPKPTTNEEGCTVGIPDIVAHQIGVRLEEGESHEIVYDSSDFVWFYDGDKDFAKQLFFEDTLGRWYKVKNSIKTVSAYIEASTHEKEKSG